MILPVNLRRTQDVGNAVYTIDLAGVYKVPPTVRLASEMNFTSSTGNSCGLVLEVGVDYLVGMSLDNDFSAHLCGPTTPLDTVTDEEFMVLENGGECID